MLYAQWLLKRKLKLPSIGSIYWRSETNWNMQNTNLFIKELIVKKSFPQFLFCMYLCVCLSVCYHYRECTLKHHQMMSQIEFL